MEILLEDLGKRYHRDWIFRHLTLRCRPTQHIALLGVNGSGKSTLIRIIAGLATPSQGKRTMMNPSGERIEPLQESAYCSFTAPYLELPEELSLQQLLNFHFEFRPLLPEISRQEIPDLMRLGAFRHQRVHQFSSGMKQRVKLGIALLTDVPFLFLDEPLTNLDNEGAAWYENLIAQYSRNRFIMVASNRPEEYRFCHETIHMHDLKESASIQSI